MLQRSAWPPWALAEAANTSLPSALSTSRRCVWMTSAIGPLAAANPKPPTVRIKSEELMSLQRLALRRASVIPRSRPARRCSNCSNVVMAISRKEDERARKRAFYGWPQRLENSTVKRLSACDVVPQAAVHIGANRQVAGIRSPGISHRRPIYRHDADRLCGFHHDESGRIDCDRRSADERVLLGARPIDREHVGAARHGVRLERRLPSMVGRQFSCAWRQDRERPTRGQRMRSLGPHVVGADLHAERKPDLAEHAWRLCAR